MRQHLLVITGCGLHSKNNFGRLYAEVGQYLRMEANIQHFRMAHIAMVGSFVVEVFQEGEEPRPPSEEEARTTMRLCP